MKKEFKQLFCRFHNSYLISHTSHQGYALLLAVVITSAVLSSAAALASIILAEIRQTRETSGAISAHARAEESSERALLLLRHTDLSFSELAPLAPDVTMEENTNQLQQFSIPENDFIALPIPTDTSAGQVTPRIMQWDVDPNCPSASWIEVTTTSWDATGSPDSPFQTRRQPFSRASDFEPNPITGVPRPQILFPSGAPVALRIRALYCAITNLSVSGIPGRVRVVSQGQEGDVRQAIETFIVRTPPAAGLFDFVLFSECELGKGLGRNPDCPPPSN